MIIPIPGTKIETTLPNGRITNKEEFYTVVEQYGHTAEDIERLWEIRVTPELDEGAVRFASYMTSPMIKN